MSKYDKFLLLEGYWKTVCYIPCITVQAEVIISSYIQYITCR